MKVSKKASYIAPQTFLHGIQIWSYYLLGVRCPFSIICRQFSYRHCWETGAMHAKPHLVKSAAVTGSSWLHSSMIIWKQKLTNNLNYCLQHYHKNYITVISLSCRGGSNFCWKKCEWIS